MKRSKITNAKRKQIGDILSKLEDKEKTYCWLCMVQELEVKEYDKCFTHLKRGLHVKWCDEEEAFACHQGEACKSCTGRKYGLGNKEVHAKTIKSQIKNGTFNMLNKEVQSNKISNKNLSIGRISKKFCEVCQSDTYHLVKRCLKCDPLNTGIKYVYCSKCNKETYHNGTCCIVCNPKSASPGFNKKHCNKCNEVTLHNGDRCSSCDPWKNSFDRDAFYASKFRAIYFEDLDKEISFDEIDSLTGVPGVWAKYGKDPATGELVCLDVSETKDIGKEMRFSVRAIAKGRENSSLSDDELLAKYSHKRNPGLYKKYRDIAKYDAVVFKLVAVDVESKEERELIEVQYAHDNEATFWSPSPGQPSFVEAYVEINEVRPAM